MKRSTLQRSRKPLARRTPKRKTRIDPDTRMAVLARSEGLCVVCGERAVQLHHVFPEEKFPELARLGVNLIGVCWQDHRWHEDAYKRIPRSALPPALLLMVEHLEPRYLLYIERTYPEGQEGT